MSVNGQEYDVGDLNEEDILRGQEEELPVGQKALGSPLVSCGLSGRLSAATQDSPISPMKTGIYPGHTHRDSSSSLDSVAWKSSPASPHVTPLNGVTCIQYVAKHNSALESVTDIIESHSSTAGEFLESAALLEVPRSSEEGDVNKAQKFFNSMISSLSFKNGYSPLISGDKKTKTRIEQVNSASAIENVVVPATSLEAKASSLPGQERKSGSRQGKLEQETFNKKLYVDEKLPGTNFRYATVKRNEDFHRIFKSISKKDRLLDDFSCALSREFLCQGRIYISENHICFNSNLLGWVTNLVIPIADVVNFEKTSTAGIFPNGIAVVTEVEKHYFASFLTRDTTFEFLLCVQDAYNSNMKALTRRSYREMPMNIANDDFFLKPLNELMQITTPPSKESAPPVDGGDSDIQEAILSVDYVTPNGPSGYASEQRTTDEVYEDVSDSEDISSEEEEQTERNMKTVFKLKDTSPHSYNGPYYFHETKFDYYPEEHDEYVLAEFSLNAAPGIVFELLFSETNPTFIREFLLSQETTQLSEITGFTQVNPDGQRFRKYRYTKALNFPVGPRSTRCLVQETVLHCDYEGYINIVNTTNTPDVPSGNSFSVKTRYMIRWASNTNSVIKISFWIEWTGSSWIRSMVDKSCKAGQIEATKTLVKQVHDYLDKNVEPKVINIDVKSEKTTNSIPNNKESMQRPGNINEKDRSHSLSSTDISLRTSLSETTTSIPISSHRKRRSQSQNLLLLFLAVIAMLLAANLVLMLKIWSRIMNMPDISNNKELSVSAVTDEHIISVVNNAISSGIIHYVCTA
ncbi:HDL551Cp [Eremothecium sinecaudum]|uniref:HDL551Cp n=1 Tax=Eremothecium sinecaudum TaxID=45286 RepID=A0A120K222_9SACH|nr:HDL551Cp [Eremothecium sinecaudum]AMD20193.1 HDL551Cp [Eremothecium sinecaudum]